MGLYFAATPGGLVSKLGFDIFDDQFQEHLTPRQYFWTRAAFRGVGMYGDYSLFSLFFLPASPGVPTTMKTLKMARLVKSWSMWARLFTNPYVLGFAGFAVGGYIAAEHGAFDQYVSAGSRNPINPVFALLQDRINTLNS